MSSKPIYTSPACSCIICRKELSAKGINSHHYASHTEEGKELTKRRTRLGAIAKNNKEQTRKTEEYSKNPKICIQCNKPHSYKARNNKFCCHSCAASYTNKTRDKSCYEKQANTLKENLSNQCFYPKLPKTVTQYTSKESHKIIYTKISQCKVCQKFFPGSRTTCSAQCLKIRLQYGGLVGGQASAAKQVRRSKDEIALYELIKPHFEKITHNEPIANGWDADILIYDTKTAILWNGPWHYQEMGFANHSLKQVQNRDRIKIQEFEKIGWTVLVFEDRYFTPETAKLQILESNQIL